MDVSQATAPSFDLLGQPFRVLGISPAATREQVYQAVAQQQRQASDALVTDVDVIVDPSRRMPYELSFDSSSAEIDALYAILSSDAAANELLMFADRLAPLSKANFVAHIAAHRPTEGALLCALVEAHVCIEPAKVYETLKKMRTAGRYPAPSLNDVHRGLQDLLKAHVRGAISGSKQMEDMAKPMLACVRQILGLEGPYQRYRIDVLGGLLARISHRVRRIGAPNQRKFFCEKDFAMIRGASRCRQSVAQNDLILEGWKAASWKRPLMLDW